MFIIDKKSVLALDQLELNKKSSINVEDYRKEIENKYIYCAYPRVNFPFELKVERVSIILNEVTISYFTHDSIHVMDHSGKITLGIKS